VQVKKTIAFILKLLIRKKSVDPDYVSHSKGFYHFPHQVFHVLAPVPAGRTDPRLCQVSCKARFSTDGWALRDLNESVLSQFAKKPPSIWMIGATVERSGPHQEPLKRISNASEIPLTGIPKSPADDVREHDDRHEGPHVITQ
jgi:hypothetical protein